MPSAWTYSGVALWVRSIVVANLTGLSEARVQPLSSLLPLPFILPQSKWKSDKMSLTINTRWGVAGAHVSVQAGTGPNFTVLEVG